MECQLWGRTVKNKTDVLYLLCKPDFQKKEMKQKVRSATMEIQNSETAQGTYTGFLERVAFEWKLGRKSRHQPASV